MTHTKDKPIGNAIVLTGRDRRVITDVADFGVLTRDHLQRLGHFGSKTRANAVLIRLVRHGYLSRRGLPSVAGTRRALYLIGPNAVDLLDRPREASRSERRRLTVSSDLFLEHQLLVNDVRLAFHRERPSYQCDRWLSDVALRAMHLGLVPDGYVEYTVDARRFAAFVELDRGTETLGRWQTKTRGYVQLATSGQFTTALGRRFFRVLVVTTSAPRLAHIRQVVAGQTDRIFWFTTLERIRTDGPLAKIWLRPVDPERHALTET